MFSSPDLRGASRRVGAWLPLVAVSAWLTLGCSVDQTGLGSMPKLNRDAGFDAVTGTGGQASGGTNGSGGSGSGGAVIGTGGTGTGGTSDSTGGTPGATGGGTGEGGMADGATGGTMGEGGAGGGDAGAAGAAGGPGGMTGTGGRGGAGGTRCSSFNCMGCCAGSVCVTATSAQQCGARGAACTACGPCQQCGATGQCAIDPTSQWTIVAQSAQVTHSPPLGTTWDPAHGDVGGSAPDLFCEYENPTGDVSPTTAGVTSTVTDVYSASWNETITPAGVTVSASALMATKPAWRIWVGDEDCAFPNATTCSSGQTACSYQQPISAAALMSGGLTISNVQSCVSLNLMFICSAGP